MQSALGVGLELGGRTNHPATKEMELTILFMDSHGYMVCFFPPREFSMFISEGFCVEKPQHSWVDMKHMAFHLDRMKDDEAGLSNTIQLK